MPEKQKSVNVWSVAHLQAAFFPIDSALSYKQDWFREITGQLANERITKPHETVEIGPLHKTMLNLNIDLLRVAFTVLPKIEAANLSGFPRLESSPEEAVNGFLDLLNRWLKLNHPPFKRVGFSGRMVQDTKNAATGNKKLRTYLPTIKLDSRSSDLLYRINRPRKSKVVPRLNINRLSTWATLKTSLSVQLMAPGSEARSAPTQESFACCFEFDFNTPADFGNELPAKRLPAIVKELSDLVLESAAKGDVR